MTTSNKYPSVTDYKHAIIDSDSFATLKNIEVQYKGNGDIHYATGNFAVVFKVKVDSKFYALKCFLTPLEDREERYSAISEYLIELKSPYFVNYSFLPNEIWANDSEFPILLMEWVEGETLGEVIKQYCSDDDKIKLCLLQTKFREFILYIKNKEIAHGDLKHDNILVSSNGSLVLVDYDGMFVPNLSGKTAIELGSKSYQHPSRNKFWFDENVDDFSMYIIYISLELLIIDTTIYSKYNNGNNIIFSEHDFQNYFNSNLFIEFIKNDYSLVLEDLIDVFSDYTESKDKDEYTLTFNLDKLFKNLEKISYASNWNIDKEKKQSIIELIVSSVDYKFENFIDDVFRYYPLCDEFTEFLLEEYNNIDRSKLFSHLSSNVERSWNFDFIRKYKDEIDWIRFILNVSKTIPWKVKDYNEFYEYFVKDSDSLDVVRFISNNKYLDKEMLQDFFLLFKTLSWLDISNNEYLEWNEEIIDRYKERLEPFYFIGNASLKWNSKLIVKYKDLIQFYIDNVSYRLPNQLFKLILENLSLFNINEALYHINYKCNLYDIIKISNSDNINFQSTIYNHNTIWTLEMIEYISDYMKEQGFWEPFLGSANFECTITFLEKYKGSIDFNSLLQNNNIKWSSDSALYFLENKDLISFYKILYKLKWDSKLIKAILKNSDILDMNRVLSNFRAFENLSSLITKKEINFILRYLEGKKNNSII